MNCIDFVTINNKTYDCYHNNIISIIHYYYLQDYNPIFWTGFDFEYQNNKTKMKYDDLYIQGCNKLTNSILNDFCGINICKQYNYKYDEYKEIIYNNIISHEPTGICIDSYYLPWNKYYKKVKRLHYILVCAMENSQNIVCYDGYLCKEYQTIPLEYIYTNMKYFLLYEKISKKEYKLSECLQYFKNVILKNNPNKTNELLSISYDLCNSNIDNYNEYDNNDIEMSSFLFQISSLYWNRCNFSDSLSYFKRMYDFDLQAMLYKTKQNCEDWHKVKMLITKAIFLKNSNFMKRAGDLIERIAYDETIITEYIKKQL